MAISWTQGCRVYAASAEGVSLATGLQTLSLWCVSATFLVLPAANKLHILWIVPIVLICSTVVIFGNIPILSATVMFVSRQFLERVVAPRNFVLSIAGGAVCLATGTIISAMLYVAFPVSYDEAVYLGLGLDARHLPGTGLGIVAWWVFVHWLNKKHRATQPK